MAVGRTPSGQRKSSSFDIIDTLSAFSVTETLKEDRGKPVTLSVTETLKEDRGKPVNLNYSKLKNILEQQRRDLGFRQADGTFAAVALDPDSEPQRRFVDAITNLGITVEATDYRSAYVSVPGGLGTRQDRPVSSLAPSLSYLLGLLAERERPEVIVVSGSFDLYGPLQDFATTRGGRAALCFFKTFLDKRWIQYGGVLAANSPIRFVDLDDHSRALVGVDLSGAPAIGRDKSRGLASM